MNKREETTEELNKVMDYLQDPKSYMTPIILKSKNGDASVCFEAWECYESVVWTLEDAFMFLIDAEDIIIPSAYARYRAANFLADHARKHYYNAMDLKDKFYDEWLGDNK